MKAQLLRLNSFLCHEYRSTNLLPLTPLDAAQENIADFDRSLRPLENQMIWRKTQNDHFAYLVRLFFALGEEKPAIPPNLKMDYFPSRVCYDSTEGKATPLDSFLVIKWPDLPLMICHAKSLSHIGKAELTQLL